MSAVPSTSQPITLNYTGVVLPYKPPIDKIAAFALLQQCNETTIENADYWTKNECSQEQFDQWEAGGIFPIDIGDRKYHRAGVGSATQYVASMIGRLSVGERKLVEVINKNNATGYLKQAKYSVPHLLREMYDIWESDDAHIDIINRTGHIVQVFMQALDESGTGLAQDEAGMTAALPYYAERLKACGNAPFTLGRYMRDMWVTNTDVGEIAERLDYWLDGWRKAQEEFERGKAAFAAMEHRREYTIQGGLKALILFTDDRFVAKAAIKSGQFQIRIVVGHDGHTAISTDKIDLSDLAAKLSKEEPGLWYYQEAQGALLNGGPQYIGTPPTRIKAREIIGLMQMFPPKRQEPKKK